LKSACRQFTKHLLPLLLTTAFLFASGSAEITIHITPDRHATVREHFSLAKTQEFVFLASPCARIENLQIDGMPEPIPAVAGPWITLRAGVDLAYDAVPISPDPRSCAVPLVMPKLVLESVSLMVEDAGSGLANVAFPHMTHDGNRWTALLPAVPSKVTLDWAQGSAPLPRVPLETGLFYWNFVGLVTVLVIWTIAYLVWAQRHA